MYNIVDTTILNSFKHGGYNGHEMKLMHAKDPAPLQRFYFSSDFLLKMVFLAQVLTRGRVLFSKGKLM